MASPSRQLPEQNDEPLVPVSRLPVVVSVSENQFSQQEGSCLSMSRLEKHAIKKENAVKDSFNMFDPPWRSRTQWTVILNPGLESSVRNTAANSTWAVDIWCLLATRMTVSRHDPAAGAGPALLKK